MNLGSRAICMAFIATAVVSLTGCGSAPTHSYRFKLTVEVTTPAGLRSGMSVYEVSAKSLNAILPDQADRTWSTKGEAVVVDLPGGQTLFALLKTGAIHGDMASLSMEALDPAFNNDVVESARRISQGQGISSPAIVERTNYPVLVRFKNISDPKSIQNVNSDDLAAIFGTGFAVKRIFVEVSDAPVTAGIEKRLPSYGPETGFDKWYEKLSFSDPRQITKDDFVGSSK